MENFVHLKYVREIFVKVTKSYEESNEDSLNKDCIFCNQKIITR